MRTPASRLGSGRTDGGAPLIGTGTWPTVVDLWGMREWSHWAEILAGQGLTLIGAYTTAMRDTGAVLLWSVPTFAALTRHLATVSTNRALRRWMEHARPWRTDDRQTLLVPSPWCATHPGWRSEPRSRRGRAG